MIGEPNCCGTCGAVEAEDDDALDQTDLCWTIRGGDHAETSEYSEDWAERCVRAEERIDVALMLLGRTGDIVADSDERAEAFYRDTHVMAPGKSVPAAMGAPWTDEYRQTVYRDWFAAKVASIRVK